jgi:transaldolase
MTTLEQLTVQIFADGANVASMLELYARPYIRGLTTNPTLMRRAGISNYRSFAHEVLSQIKDKPISFEVLTDDIPTMEREALEIASWADNVFVKIPVTNTRRESCAALISSLARRQVKLNVTAIMTLDQVRAVASALSPATPSYVSVFAGRIADTGIDPLPVMAQALELLRGNANARLMWASSRELLNILQANSIGCPVITVTADILGKLHLLGYDLERLSLDTVRMFHDDAQAAGFSL